MIFLYLSHKVPEQNVYRQEGDIIQSLTTELFDMKKGQPENTNIVPGQYWYYLITITPAQALIS